MSDGFSDRIEKQFVHGALIGGVYKVLDFIGEGGMGLVYRVEHTLMHKEMALKVLKTEHLSAAEWLRFRKEAQAIARLDHINVIKICDMNQTLDGRPYYTMDLLVGQSLDNFLKQNERLPIEIALPIFRQECAGLAYAHERGVIHRDIKPGNIMLLKGNSVKIVDFGLAKLVDDGGQTIQGLTNPGEIFGSPLYMSPEQCLGGKVDARSDIYSLGVTMYQALTGRPPLLGRSAVETTMLHQLEKAPSLHDKAADLDFPQPLELMVAKMLAKSPEDRYSSLAEVAAGLLTLKSEDREETGLSAMAVNRQPQRLQTIDDTGGSTSSTGGKTQQSRLAVIAAAVTALAMGLVFVFMLQKPNKQLKIAGGTTLPKFEVIREIDDQDLPLIDKYLRGKNQFQFYSKTVALPGKKRRFDFPTEFSIGSLTCVSTINGARSKFKARGTVELPADCAIEYDTNDNAKARPELLQFFRPDDLFLLRLEMLSLRNPKLSHYISRLRSLRHLELAGTGLTNEDLTELEKLKHVMTLTIGATSIDGKHLARSSILKGLRTISLSGLSNVSPVLRELAHFQKMGSINLSNTKIEKADLKVLNTMRGLQSIWLRHTDVEDADMETLSLLPNLTYLNIDGCKKLTPKCLSSFRKFNAISELYVPDGILTEESLKKLMKDRPSLKKVAAPVTL